jgi:two-component system, chemotaxis family, protein-glutamate methylesterase/glutaminase
MPVLDGVGFVRQQMARRPLPIVLISIAAESGEQVLAALDAGAIDFVQKPTALATERLMDMSDELVEKVKAAAKAPVGRLPVPLDRRPGAAVARAPAGRGG